MYWSFTYDRQMRRCQRQLPYAQHVASAVSHDQKRREAFILRQVKTLPEWYGDLVHKTLETRLVPALAMRQRVTVQQLIDEMITHADRQWRFSERRRYREKGMAKTKNEDFSALSVHENGEQVSQDEVMAQVRRTAEVCFGNLFSGAGASLLGRLERGFGHAAEHTLSFPFNGWTIRAKLDLYCRETKGSLVIVDWKVVEGETDDYAKQLYLYALVALRSGRMAGIAPEAVTLVEANLLLERFHEYPVTQERLDDVEDWVYRSTSEMAILLRGISKNDFRLEDYPVTEKATTCQLCSFCRLCVEDIQQIAAESTTDVALAEPFLSQLKF